jgi:DNA-binding NtrC family response regulator
VTKTATVALKVLIVDDHQEVRQSLGEFLQQLGHQVVHASNGKEALRVAADEKPDLLLSDLRMPVMSGMELLQALEELDDPPPIAVMTAFGDAETAIEAMRLGAVDYLRKPINVEELHRLVERIAAADFTPVPAASQTREEADGLVVCGQEITRLVGLADRFHEATDLPCLIEGETGVGKELFARRIHHGPGANDKPFIALNCAAISPSLFEAELFGYAAGAFTGALASGNAGKLSMAANGTLFLDEIGDLPTDQQAKLLRLLEDKSWYPVGSNKIEKLKARVVCATNARLLDVVRSGKFREDLYYRLKVGHIRIPPLRERKDSILPLALVFLSRIRRSRGRGFQKISSAAETALREFSWPGNIRQLHHALEQACVQHDAAVLDVEHLQDLLCDRGVATAKLAKPPAPATLGALPPDQLTLDPNGFDLDKWQQAVIAAALNVCDGSPVRCAKYLGITRKVLYTLRKRYGLLGNRMSDRQDE